MQPTIQLRISRETGLPCAVVPSLFIWDLVEHLARHRTRVNYSYGPTDFRVCFLNLDLRAAQQVLDDWAAGFGAAEWEHAHASSAEAAP